MIRNILSFIAILLGIILYQLFTKPSLATFSYIMVSYVANFDGDTALLVNKEGELESGIFTHHFVQLNQTHSGLPVDVVYHVVECGDQNAEPIVFGHGLCESWRVWKNIMAEFCDTHRVIAYDSEGMGQSPWPNVLRDLPKGQSTTFMADMQMEMLRRIGVNRFNLVITDYSFWSTLSMLTEYGEDVILRYGKLQSTVGVEDPARIPQGKLMKFFPQTMDFVTNMNRAALARVLFGKSLLPWPAVETNRRNAREISDETFANVILPGLREKGLTAWVYFYHYGKDMCAQMSYQLDAFNRATFPVLIMQGNEDKGQPKELFDGTATMQIVEAPIEEDGLRERLSRLNKTHKVVTHYSADGTVIGPKADAFFPNSPWVKTVRLDGVGHFLHLEAHDELVVALKELLSVPLRQKISQEDA